MCNKTEAPGQLEVRINLAPVDERVPQHHKLLLLVTDLCDKGSGEGFWVVIYNRFSGCTLQQCEGKEVTTGVWAENI